MLVSPKEAGLPQPPSSLRLPSPPPSTPPPVYLPGRLVRVPFGHSSHVRASSLPDDLPTFMLMLDFDSWPPKPPPSLTRWSSAPSLPVVQTWPPAPSPMSPPGGAEQNGASITPNICSPPAVPRKKGRSPLFKTLSLSSKLSPSAPLPSTSDHFAAYVSPLPGPLSTASSPVHPRATILPCAPPIPGMIYNPDARRAKDVSPKVGVASPSPPPRRKLDSSRTAFLLRGMPSQLPSPTRLPLKTALTASAPSVKTLPEHFAPSAASSSSTTPTLFGVTSPSPHAVCALLTADAPCAPHQSLHPLIASYFTTADSQTLDALLQPPMPPPSIPSSHAVPEDKRVSDTSPRAVVQLPPPRIISQGNASAPATSPKSSLLPSPIRTPESCIQSGPVKLFPPYFAPPPLKPASDLASEESIPRAHLFSFEKPEEVRFCHNCDDTKRTFTDLHFNITRS
jgi:hypothetical protein